MVVLDRGRTVGLKKRQEPRSNHGQYIGRGMFNQLRFSGTPVQALELIGKNDASHAATLWQEHLKRISFDSGCNWTEQSQANFSVVGRTRSEGGTITRAMALRITPRREENLISGLC